MQRRRPSLYDLVDRMAAIAAPTAALVVMGNAGHAINLEEPALFNRHLEDLFHAADLGKWPKRDPGAVAAALDRLNASFDSRLRRGSG